MSVEEVDVKRLVHLCLDEQGFQTKPEGIYWKISDRIPHCETDITIQQLAKEITLPNAKAFCPAVFKESLHKSKPEKGIGLWRQNIGWKQQQIIAVDIDEKLSFHDAIARCEKYNLLPVFAYNTFSDINLDKFRLVFCLPEPIEDVLIHQLILKSLVVFFFPEADNCKEPARMFMGGKSIIYENYSSTIDIHEIIDAVCHFITDTDKTNANKQIVAYCQAVGLNTVNNKPAVNKVTISADSAPTNKEYKNLVTKSQQVLLIYYRTCLTLVSKYTLYLTGETTKSKSKKTGEYRYNISNEKIEREKLRNIKSEDILDKCKLTRDFVSGKHWAEHPELFGLATNLLCIDGGQKLFKDGLNSRPEYASEEYKNKKQDFENYHINHINKSNYNPQWCKEYCSFETECEHQSTIIETVSSNRGEVKELVKQVLVPITESETALQNVFSESLISDKRISVINAETGLGKTETYLKSCPVSCVIATPTHQLKEEIGVRLEAESIDFRMTPERPKLSDKDERWLNKLYKMGAHEKANQHIHKLSGEDEELQAYFKELEEVKNYKGIIITTHERAILTFQDYDGLIIFDEDPIESLFKINHMKIEHLHDFRSALGAVMVDFYDEDLLKAIDELITHIDKLPDNSKEGRSWGKLHIGNLKSKIIERMFQLKYRLYEQEVISTGTSNVFDFLNCDYFIKEGKYIHYIKKRELPGKQVIIMSATAPEFIYKKLYADDMQFIKISRAYKAGKVIQYLRYSFSRYQMIAMQEQLNKLKDFVADAKVITFKKFKDEFENTVATFGALRGLDFLKGEDTVIVGTPHTAPVVYYLYAMALGIEYTDEETKMQSKNIEHDGFNFHFNTFTKNEGLKQIQLWKISSELEQAVGRSRTSREDCTVIVFSSYPIQGAEFREIKELYGWVDMKESKQAETCYRESDNEDLMAI